MARVSETINQLSTDVEALHALLAAAHAERDAALAERDQALSQIDRLRHLLHQLQRAQFGRRSEKLDPEQLLLALEDIEQAIAGDEAREDKKNAAAAEARAAKRRANRGALPAFWAIAREAPLRRTSGVFAAECRSGLEFLSDIEAITTVRLRTE